LFSVLRSLLSISYLFLHFLLRFFHRRFPECLRLVCLIEGLCSCVHVFYCDMRRDMCCAAI
jgi:hypothetical protein